MILNYSGKQEKKKLIYFSERKNNQALKAVHPLQVGSNAMEEYGTEEAKGFILNVIGMNRFYYLRNFHDMHCKYEWVLSIIH